MSVAVNAAACPAVLVSVMPESGRTAVLDIPDPGGGLAGELGEVAGLAAERAARRRRDGRFASRAPRRRAPARLLRRRARATHSAPPPLAGSTRPVRWRGQPARSDGKRAGHRPGWSVRQLQLKSPGDRTAIAVGKLDHPFVRRFRSWWTWHHSASWRIRFASEVTPTSPLLFSQPRERVGERLSGRRPRARCGSHKGRVELCAGADLELAIGAG